MEPEQDKRLSELLYNQQAGTLTDAKHSQLWFLMHFYYPDVMITCDEQDRRAIQVIYYPCVIVEVLSPSTEAKDRGQKFQNHRRISTFKEYVLISSEQKMIECFRWNEKGVWELYTYLEGDEFELKYIDFSCPIELIYEDVILAAVEEDSE